MNYIAAIALWLALAMVGCSKPPVYGPTAKPTPSAEDLVWSQLDYNLQITTLFNRDTSILSKMTVATLEGRRADYQALRKQHCDLVVSINALADTRPAGIARDDDHVKSKWCPELNKEPKK